MRHYEYKYGIYANPNINIGTGLNVVHGDNIFINCKYVGNNVTIYLGVMLGQGKDGLPQVEDNITIYTGAVVTGNIKLETGCIIGANSYVGKDVYKNTFVAGIPAKEIRK